MKRLALLLLLLPASCANPFSGGPSMPDDACRAYTNEDPTVRRELQRYAGGGGNAFRENRAPLDDARLAAYSRCMRTKPGATQRGGVEPLKR